MDHDVIIFWLVGLLCLAGLRVALRQLRGGGAGWVVLLFLILAIDVTGWLLGKSVLIYAAAATWLLFVLLPGLLGKLYFQRFLQQRYSDARRLAMVISWLHPADGWREQHEFVRAAELAQRGDFGAASEILNRYQEARSVVSLVAMPSLYRITNEWEKFIVWEAEHSWEIEKLSQLLPSLLRARGETGDRHGLIELYDRRKNEIARLTPPAVRDLCRLMLFVFSGKRHAVERLFAGSLAVMPVATQGYWLAVTDRAAGEREAAKRQFELLSPKADPPMRRAIERHLTRISDAQPPLTPAEASVVESAALEFDHDSRFGAQPSLFAKQARATQFLIFLNVLMFTAEIVAGGSYNLDALYRLGALFPPAVRAGELWRLVASLFLHVGPVHLGMNMVGLWVLGPFVESVLGFWRYLFVYLASGIGSMLVVMIFGSGPTGEQLTVGASGSVMALLGATGALMLFGWLRENADPARRRLILMVAILAMQVVFDALVPQVSMTGHLSGAALGLVLTAVLAYRLTHPQAPVAPSQKKQTVVQQS